MGDVLFSPLKMQKTIKKNTRSIAHLLFNSLPYLLCSFPYSLQEEKTGKGLPFPSCSSFLVFLSYKGEQEKRRGREGERSDERKTILRGRAKKGMEERWIKERERQNKAQRRWHSSLSILSPLSLQGIEQTGSKETEWQNLSQSFIYLPCLSLLIRKNQSCYSQIDRCPSSSSGNRLSLIWLFEANKKNNR